MLNIASSEFALLLRSVLDRGGSLKFETRGSSMSPFIRDSDWVTTAPLGRRAVRLGDIVACVVSENERPIIHRVVSRKNGCYLIKGDRTASADGHAYAEDIIGRVTVVERNDRKVMLGLGPERVMIAILSRVGLLRLLGPLGRLVRFLGGR